MAPITLATANVAYERTITRLLRACVSLEHKLPPIDPKDETFSEAPALRPGPAR